MSCSRRIWLTERKQRISTMTISHPRRPQTWSVQADKDLKSLETVVKTELKNVCDWLHANELTFNAKKSNYVVFRPR